MTREDFTLEVMAEANRCVKEAVEQEIAKYRQEHRSEPPWMFIKEQIEYQRASFVNALQMEGLAAW
jgi:hypothetical protein